MKNRFLLTAVLVVLISLVFVLPVAAQGFIQTPEPVDPLGQLLLQWGGLAGFGAAVSFLVNILKTVGVVKDGQAQKWVAGLNLLGLAALLAFQVYKPDMDLDGADKIVSKFVEVGTVVFSFVLQMISSKGTYAVTRGLPVVGKSNSPIE